MTAPDEPETSAAEEARALTAGTSIATLATLDDDGAPWASMVAFGTLDDGTPVLWVSALAAHGRHLARDQRASLSVVGPPVADQLATGRVTLAGHVERPDGDEEAAARAAYMGAVRGANLSADFHDFTLWVLRVERVRWVGGYGRMDDVVPEAYASASPV